MRRWIWFVVLWGVILAGCGGAPPEPTNTPLPPESTATMPPEDSVPEAALGEPVDLRVDEVVVFGGGGLEVGFMAVTEDSRCPTEVECFWAGQAVVLLAVTLDGQAVGPVSLSTIEAAPNDVLRQATVGGYTISLADVRPYPESPGGIAAGDYVAELVVTLDGGE